MQNPLTVAIVGAGFMGRNHLHALRSCDLTEPVAIVDPAESAADFARGEGLEYFRTVEEFVSHGKRADAAVVASPDRLHLEPALALIAAGIPTLIEKPLAHNARAAEQLLSASQQGNVRLMVGQLLRYEPHYQQAHDAIRSGAIGEPLHLTAHRYAPRSLGTTLAGRSSPLFYLGIHDIDLAHWLLGAENTQSVSAHALRGEDLTADAIFSTIVFENGTVAQLGAGWTLPQGTAADINATALIVGSEGSIELDVRQGGLTVTTHEKVRFPDASHWPTSGGRVTGALLEEVRDFAWGVATGAEFRVKPEEALRAVSTMDKIHQAVGELDPETNIPTH